MQRYKILHRTYYNFSGTVKLGPRHLRLRPRQDYEMRIESSTLTIRSDWSAEITETTSGPFHLELINHVLQVFRQAAYVRGAGVNR